MSVARQPELPFELDELELAALAPQPTREGAAWTTLQFVQHFWETAVRRDPRTLSPLPRLLSEVLRDLPTGGTHPRPLPADLISIAATGLARPLSRILANPTSRVTRDHVMQPVHSLREVDARSMTWLAQRPGRTIREKLGGRPHALGVVRPMSVETRENRVVRRVLATIWSQLEPRLSNLGAFAAEPQLQMDLEELERLCTTRLRASDLASVRPADAVSANNVLLDHADYSRVWRFWQLMHRQDEVLPELWSRVEQLFAEVARWRLIQALAAATDASIRERLVLVDGLLAPGLRFIDRSTEDSIPVVQLSRGGPDGRVKSLIERDGRMFGFIARKGADDCYFDQRYLGTNLRMSDFTEGSLVNFTVTSGRQGSTQAQHVTPWTRLAQRSELSREGTRVRLGEAIVVGQGAGSEWEVKLVVRGELAPGRGLPIVAQPIQGARHSWSGFADAQGLEEFVAWTIDRSMSKTGKYAQVPDVQAWVVEDIVGLDRVGERWVATRGGESDVVPAATRTVRTGAQPDGHLWLTSAPDMLWAAEHPVCDSWSVDRLLYAPPDEPGERVIGVDRIVTGLAKHLPRPAYGLAWTVADDLQDLDQKALRTTLALHFGKALPVWRSIASGTAWLRQTRSPPKEGDSLLVLDASGHQLSAVFLVARCDLRLRKERPDSHGVYWERRPPVPSDAEHAGLASAAFLRCYARHLTNRAAAASPISHAGRARLADWLFESGLADRLTHPGESEAVRMEGHWFALARDSKAMNQAARDWTRTLRDAVGAWSAESPLGELVRNPPGRGALRVLLVGRCFTRWCNPRAVQSALTPLTGDLPIDSIDVEKGTLSLGAREVMERSHQGLITWRDWLPDLYLEVVRDGLFDELTLVEGRQVDASLGQLTRIEVDQPLVLPAGLSAYTFPLETGRENRRPTGRNIELRSRFFPLDSDVPVELGLRYRYGLADAWELEVSPRGTEQPFGRLKAAWTDTSRPIVAVGAGPVPPFANHRAGAPKSKGVAALEDFAGWFSWKAGETDWEDLEACDYLARRLKGMRWAFYAVPDATDWSRLLKRGTTVELVRELLTLSGLSSALGPDPMQLRYREHRTLHEEALILLSCMGPSAPEGFREELARRARKVLQDPERMGNRAVAPVDAAGRQLAAIADADLEEVLWQVLDQVRPWQSPRLHLRAMAAWGRVAWRREEFVFGFALAHPDAPLRLLSTAARQLGHLTQQVAKTRSIADERRGYFLFPYQTCCEVLLALLRLRQADDCHGLEVGQPRLDALARTVRRLDGMLTLRGCPADGSRLKLSVDKPAHLHRVSDLAWLLSSMLTGTEDLGHVHIEATDDD